MEHYGYCEYIKFDGEDFFTVVLLPEKDGSFPSVIYRSPYVQDTVCKSEDEILKERLCYFNSWLERGYALVYQHCRGQGKSTGAFVPYIHEHEDGIALRQWVRSRYFYNGELFLLGASYTASLHYATAPFESDIKGAVLEIQDAERYRLWYRNGQMRKGHANWYFGLYKSKCGLNKSYSYNSFSELPLKDLSERALNDRAEDFEQMLAAQHPSDEFWSTRYGGADTKNAADKANIPILFTTGYNDFYVGGMFKMWNNLSKETKSKCAMLVSPYNHGDSPSRNGGITFAKGKRAEQFGSTYQIDWFDNIRTDKPISYKKGVITYYRTFEDKWEGDFYASHTEPLVLTLGTEEASFCYNPLTPPTFSAEGDFQHGINTYLDVISLYTEPLFRDVFIKGQMKAVLAVSSSCPDTSFYVSISIEKPDGDYVLRHDIRSLCYQLGDYTENTTVMMDFCFDEYAFLLRKGERLRIDIASTDNNTYVCHTNKKGPYYLQTKTDIASNKVYLDSSSLILPIEKTL